PKSSRRSTWRSWSGSALGLKRAVGVRATPWRPGTAVPRGAKVVHLIRHGQGFHDRLGDIYRDFGRPVDSTGADSLGSPYTRQLFDPPLTTTGRDQAKALRPVTRALEGIDLVVVSPLQRAVQTAALGMPHLKQTVCWIAHEDCMETSGTSVCDKRRDSDEIGEDFPWLDLSLLTEPEDPLWTPDARETCRAVSDRTHSFALWLRDRQESNIVVATHSAWLFTLLNTAVDCEPRELNQWFHTGELRSVVFEFVDKHHCETP
ncbi:unnamed protein product, partial [Polarella glacialis]